MKIGLGTVQFGLDYGISNRGGRVATESVMAMLDAAMDAHVDMLDTASAYGDAERVLGECQVAGRGFSVVTKLPPLPEPPPADIAGWVRSEFKASCARLGVQALHGLMLHRAGDLLGAKGDAIWRALEDLQDAGRVQVIGASVYDGGEVDALLQKFPVSLVQVPINLLDQRLIEGGQLDRLKQHDVEVHARSLLLQGLLLLDPDSLSSHFDSARLKLRTLRDAAASQDLSPLQAALGFAATVPQLDRVIIGVTSVDELRTSVAALRGAGLSDYRSFALQDPAILNPALWPPRS